MAVKYQLVSAQVRYQMVSAPVSRLYQNINSTWRLDYWDGYTGSPRLIYNGYEGSPSMLLTTWFWSYSYCRTPALMCTKFGGILDLWPIAGIAMAPHLCPPILPHRAWACFPPHWFWYKTTILPSLKVTSPCPPPYVTTITLLAFNLKLNLIHKTKSPKSMVLHLYFWVLDSCPYSYMHMFFPL